MHDAGVPVYFMVGNRDFLLGQAFAERAGLTVLEDGTVHDIHGQPTLLMHGDVLCTDDVAYQAVREQVRTPEWQAQILAMPLAGAPRVRRQGARGQQGAYRQHDGKHHGRQRRRRSRSHAHGQRDPADPRPYAPPGDARIPLDGAPAQRIVLGDWYEQGSVLRVTRTGSNCAGWQWR